MMQLVRRSLIDGERAGQTRAQEVLARGQFHYRAAVSLPGLMPVLLQWADLQERSRSCYLAGYLLQREKALDLRLDYGN